MIHSPMSAQTSSNHTSNALFTLTPSPSFLSLCSLSKTLQFQPADSAHLAHSSQKRGGIPPSVPIRKSARCHCPSLGVWASRSPILPVDCPPALRDTKTLSARFYPLRPTSQRVIPVSLAF